MLRYLWAGGPSMMMLIHRICMALSGLGKFISVTKEMSVRAAMLLETSRARSGRQLGSHQRACLTHVLSWKRTKFLMLL